MLWCASTLQIEGVNPGFEDGSAFYHYTDVIMGAITSQITSLAIVYSTVYSGADQRKHQSSASLAFVRGVHRGPVNSPHKWPVTRKMFPFDDVIMWRHALEWPAKQDFNSQATCACLFHITFSEVLRCKHNVLLYPTRCPYGISWHRWLSTKLQ